MGISCLKEKKTCSISAGSIDGWFSEYKVEWVTESLFTEYGLWTLHLESKQLCRASHQLEKKKKNSWILIDNPKVAGFYSCRTSPRCGQSPWWLHSSTFAWTLSRSAFTCHTVNILHSPGQHKMRLRLIQLWRCLFCQDYLKLQKNYWSTKVHK